MACITLLMGISDEFRSAILPCIPTLVTLLTDNDDEVCRVSADALVKLSEAGEQE